jgi:hypothetical protein
MLYTNKPLKKAYFDQFNTTMILIIKSLTPVIITCRFARENLYVKVSPMLAMLSTGKHIYSYFWNKYEFIKVDD